MGARKKSIRSTRRLKHPLCVVIAGPNGAGKTTFARRYLSGVLQIEHFVNADLIAAGLSPLAPSSAALRAGRLVLQEIDRLARARESFAFESTLSGRAYEKRLKRLKRLGYRIEIVFLRVASPQLALRRIAARVRQGGHDVPKADVLRRFDRGWANFLSIYQPLADAWVTYENSGRIAKELARAPELMNRSARHKEFAKGVQRALKQAALDARRTARRFGTPIYLWENGRVVAKDP